MRERGTASAEAGRGPISRYSNEMAIAVLRAGRGRRWFRACRYRGQHFPPVTRQRVLTIVRAANLRLPATFSFSEGSRQGTVRADTDVDATNDEHHRPGGLDGRRLTPGQRLARLAAEAAGAPTPRAALRILTELRQELDAFERRQVAHALAEGSSFAAVARDLGITRQAVHRRFRGLAAAETPLVTAPEVRRVLQYAREEAAALGTDDLRGEHILLAVLRASELDAAVILRAAGASLERARAQVEGASARSRLFRREAESDLRTLLDAPARHARARDGRRIEVEDLLLGSLEDRTGGAYRTLSALGVDVDQISRHLEARLGSPL